MLPLVASAHEHATYTIDGAPYQIVIGSLNEPVAVDDKTGVDLTVNKCYTAACTATKGPDGDMDGPAGTPVTGLESTLKVELVAGDQKSPSTSRRNTARMGNTLPRSIPRSQRRSRTTSPGILLARRLTSRTRAHPRALRCLRTTRLRSNSPTKLPRPLRAARSVALWKKLTSDFLNDQHRSHRSVFRLTARRV